MIKKDKWHQFHFRILNTTWERLKNVAEMKGLTMQALFTVIINEWLDNQNKN